MKTARKKLTIGWRETVSLPDLGLPRVKAKIDTGALTTALHATAITEHEIGGRPHVRFRPDHEVLAGVDDCLLPVLHRREITNTSGIPELRYIVATTLRIGTRGGRVEISLTDRSDMTFPIIVGRSALRLLRLTVDPSRSWLHSTRSAAPEERKSR